MQSTNIFRFLVFFTGNIFNLLLATKLFSHGFDPRIYVNTSISKNKLIPIKLLCENCLEETQQVCSFNLSKNKYVKSRLTAAATAQSKAYIVIHFNDDPFVDIICTPEQEFYTWNKQWIAAHRLKIGDSLFSKGNVPKKISHIRLVHESITVYTIHVNKTHTFFVGRNAVLTHNMLLLPFTAGIGAAFCKGAGAGAIAASVFGPLTVVAGLAVGGLFGIAIKNFLAQDKLPNYQIKYDPDILNWKSEKENPEPQNKKNDDAQAPGKPTENDGYFPPKNWDGKKVKHPKTGQYGYPDKKGNIWVPTGPGPLAHGGPHWDVVSKDGRKNRNILPGGKIRGN